MAALTLIDEASDPRLGDYVGLRDVDLRARHELAAGVFIAEGKLVIRRLLESRYPVRSLLLTPERARELADVVARVDAPVYVADREVVRTTVGFDLHRGAVAAAARLPLTPADEILASATAIAVLESVNDHENLGAIFRSASALGIDAVLLCPRSSDPLYRRCVRVSMGEVLTVPFTRLDPWPEALGKVAAAGFRILALTPRPTATPIAAVDVRPGERVALLFGAEGPGLSDEALDAADAHVRIPLRAGVDSLNVGHAAAIAFHRFGAP